MITKHLIILTFLCQTVLGQSINFDKQLGWNEIREKAKQENKFIFLDVTATWCGPCKKMEKEIYPNADVSKLVNDSFISVKVQSDRTLHDNSYVKKWYSSADSIFKTYAISAWPTYLFFLPDGRLIHKEVGFKNKMEFMEMCNYAMSANAKKFYTDLEDYNKGRKEISTLEVLLQKSIALLNNRELARRIAKDYKTGYLDHISLTEMFDKKNLSFFSNYHYLLNSTDSYFKIIFDNKLKIDSIIGIPGWSEKLVQNVISKDEIWNKLFKDSMYRIPYTREPNWDYIYNQIKNKYHASYADLLVPQSKIKFYKQIKDWRTFARLRTAFIVKYPPNPKADLFDPKSVWALNVDAWDVFLHCDDKDILRRALSWSDLTIKLETDSNVQYLDTKANLLYKLGRNKEAIELERKAYELTTNGGQQEGSEDYKRVINKMILGEPTWNIN